MEACKFRIESAFLSGGASWSDAVKAGVARSVNDLAFSWEALLEIIISDAAMAGVAGHSE